MPYTWLKRFAVDVGDAYPRFRIHLEIVLPKSWNYSVPFYTFAVKLQVDASVFGWYLYVGDLVNSVIEPGKEFIVDANLRLIDIRALSHRNI